MSAGVVGVLLDLYDGTGTPVSQGVAQLTPTAQLTDNTAGMLVTESPVRVDFRGGLPVVDLIPNDAPGLVPGGSSWRISFSEVPGSPAGQTVQIPAGPAAFIVAAGNPAVFTWTPPNAMFEASGLPNGTGITLAGVLPAAFSSGNTYWVVAASGPTFQLARTPGGAPVATDGTGSGQLRVTQWRLSALAAARQAGTAWSAVSPRSADGQAPAQRTASVAQGVARTTGGGTSPGPVTRTGNWTPVDQGLIAWTQDPAETTANSQLPAAGTLYLCRVHVTSDARVTNILTAVTSSNSTLTKGQCFAALYGTDGSLLAATEDQSRAWAASGLKTMPLSGGPVDVAAGDYYIGIYANGSTLPNFARGNNQIAHMVNAGLSSGFRFATGVTRLTAAPPSSAGDLSVSAFAWWLALS